MKDIKTDGPLGFEFGSLKNAALVEGMTQVTADRVLTVDDLYSYFLAYPGGSPPYVFTAPDATLTKMGDWIVIINIASMDIKAHSGQAISFPGAIGSTVNNVRTSEYFGLIKLRSDGATGWFAENGQGLWTDVTTGAQCFFNGPKRVKKQMFVPIEDFIDGGTPPAAAETLTDSPGSVRIRKFDDAADEDVNIMMEMPGNVVDDTFAYRVVGWISEATGPASGEGVAFELANFEIAQGGTLGSTLTPTPVVSSLADLYAAGVTDQYDRFITDWSDDMAVNAGDGLFLKINRDVSHGDDDYAQDVGVAGVWLQWEEDIDRVS